MESSSSLRSEDDFELYSSQSSGDDLEQSKKEELHDAIYDDGDLDEVKSILTERPDLLWWVEFKRVQRFWVREGQNCMFSAM